MRVPALKVNQWMSPEWDEAQFDNELTRRKPEPHFYVFSISAKLLKKLTGVYRRDPNGPPAEDHGIQRKHRPERSQEILRYLQFGFPLSRIDHKKLVDPSEKASLQMPGWLPTAVVVNILLPEDKRGFKRKTVSADQLVDVNGETADGFACIEIPPAVFDDDWHPAIHPIEVIDGQHRLWALEEPEDAQKALWTDAFKDRINGIQIPVVAFHGLDVTWQAYLFYTINQLAKKIDTSMVFDLYPLLRTQEWLLRFEGTNVYREARAQDLTILLWSHPQSPWKGRIIRLGGREKGKITQAAFLRSLMASFIKRWRTGAGRLGGLFGSPLGSHQATLNWGREQQAAFLIAAWIELKDKIEQSSAPWTATILQPGIDRSALFSGADTLIATDQGVRGFLCVLNDLIVADFDSGKLDLAEWEWEPKDDQTDEEAVTDALGSLRLGLPKTMARVEAIAKALASFDWRVSSALQPTHEKYSIQASYRGSSGYKEIRRQLLQHIRESGTALAGLVESAAGELIVDGDEEF
jgi:DGQHR domain-containing protein